MYSLSGQKAFWLQYYVARFHSDAEKIVLASGINLDMTMYFVESIIMYFDQIDICACVNGIICLRHCYVVLWNLEIKEFKVASAPPFPNPNVSYYKTTCIWL